MKILRCYQHQVCYFLSILKWHFKVQSAFPGEPTARDLTIEHYIIVCLVAWPLSESEAGVDVVLIEISLLFVYNLMMHKVQRHCRN